LLFTDILERHPENISKFANVIGSLTENFLDKLNMTFFDLFMNNSMLKNNPLLSSRLMALCTRISEICEGQAIAPKRAAESILASNKLGPIVFCSPELGRWSTVGGLGVMVDELAQGLVMLGQEVWVISPYYERNRKGETGYLAKDPAGINYTENINISLPCGGTLGVHEGEVAGVKVVFLHNVIIY
jgi:starch synthase